MKYCFAIGAVCMMLIVVSMPAKAQAVFGAHLHTIEEEAAAAETQAWAMETEAWAATVRGNISERESAWLQMISRTRELLETQQERALTGWNVSDTLFARKRVSALREDVSIARDNAVFARQMALGAQERENMAKAKADSLEKFADWRSEPWAWDLAAEAHGIAYKAWLNAADSWDRAAQSLAFSVESWDETRPIELSDLFNVLQKHLTPEGVIALVWENPPLDPVARVPAFRETGAFDFSGEVNERVKFGQFIDMANLWPTDIELDDFLLEVPPGCRVNADALSGSEAQQDFVACLISFLAFYCPPGAYIFKINDEYHAYSSNVACATRD